jgi:hypothetical protein
MNKIMNSNYRELIKFEIARARRYFDRAEEGIKMLSPDARLPVRESVGVLGMSEVWWMGGWLLGWCVCVVEGSSSQSCRPTKPTSRPTDQPSDRPTKSPLLHEPPSDPTQSTDSTGAVVAGHVPQDSGRDRGERLRQLPQGPFPV